MQATIDRQRRPTGTQTETIDRLKREAAIKKLRRPQKDQLLSARRKSR